ncbi:MAG: DUF4390 domain-containing protein [Proteobacteria bacterium]|nr:DUF4390 domain-containing protein [Pseudomonadota bacterium]
MNTRGRYCCYLIGLLWVASLLSVATVTATAAEYSSVQRVWFEKKADGYAVRADLEVGQQEFVEKVLRGGYPLAFKFELNFMQRQEWYLDRVIGDLIWQGTLSYDSLTQVYLLVNESGREQRFSTLTAALDKINQLRAGSSNDRAYINILLRDDIYLRARFYYLTSHLPEPMQIGLLLDAIWNNKEWITFPLEVRE